MFLLNTERVCDESSFHYIKIRSSLHHSKLLSNDMSKRDSLYAGNHSIRMSGVFQKIFINFRNRKEIKHKDKNIFSRFIHQVGTECY